jgi:uncharacterized protein (DUF2267 family)
MTDNLRNRIAAVVQQALISEVRERQDYVNGPYFDTDDEGEDVGDSLIGIDGSVTPAKVADAVIEALGLEVEDGECGYCHAQLPGCRYSTWETTGE